MDIKHGTAIFARSIVACIGLCLAGGCSSSGTQPGTGGNGSGAAIGAGGAIDGPSGAGGISGTDGSAGQGGLTGIDGLVGAGGGTGIDAAGVASGGGATGTVDGGTDASLPPPIEEPTIDLSDFPVHPAVDAGGGTVALPGGPSIEIPPGTLDPPTEIGLRPSSSPPSLAGTGYTALTGWFDLATSRLFVRATSSNFVLSMPVAPPVGAESHPGLEILMYIGDRLLPFAGAYQPSTGRFEVELTGLPTAASLVVAFNPNIVETSATATTDNSVDAGPAFERSAPGGGCFRARGDRGVVLDEARLDKVETWAVSAFGTYLVAGFSKPLLTTDRRKGCWPIHIIPEDNSSYYGPDEFDQLGQIYLSANRIDDPKTAVLGSGMAAIAHEMFHAVVAAYNIPVTAACNPGGTFCPPSLRGLDEGMATAVGYWLDQVDQTLAPGPGPRRDNPARKLSDPHGYFDPAAMGTAYTNQDFYVYLLRRQAWPATLVAQLYALKNNIRPTGGWPYGALAAYGNALDSNSMPPFSETYAWYAADRLYEHSAYAQLRSGDLTGYRLDPDSKLLDDTSQSEVTAQECDSNNNPLDCQTTLAGVPPLAARLVTVNLANLDIPDTLKDQPLTLTASATASTGKVYFTVYGENNGWGDGTAWAHFNGGAPAVLSDVNTKWPMVRLVVVAAQAAQADVTLTLSFACGPREVWDSTSKDCWALYLGTLDYCDKQCRECTAASCPSNPLCVGPVCVASPGIMGASDTAVDFWPPGSSQTQSTRNSDGTFTLIDTLSPTDEMVLTGTVDEETLSATITGGGTVGADTVEHSGSFIGTRIDAVPTGGTTGTGGVSGAGGVTGTGGITGGGGSCSDLVPCGGDVVGTWAVTTSCLKLAGEVDMSAFGLGCTSAPVTGSLQVTGTWAANSDGTYSDNTTTSGEEVITLPASCLNMSGIAIPCSLLGTVLTALGYSSVSCTSAADGGCTCPSTVQQTGGLGMLSSYPLTSGTYETSGNLLTLDGGPQYSYCVSGNQMAMTPQTTNPTTTGSVVFQKQ
jgi:hypothetical protein